MTNDRPSRTCLISGISRGIGAATAKKLLMAGHNVLGLSRSTANPDNDWLPEHLRGNLTLTECDVTDTAQLENVIPQLQREHPIDCVICNAGVGRFGSLEEFSLKQIQRLINTNLLSHIYLCRLSLPSLKQRERSDIVFIGSESALAGGRYGAVYSASKFGLRGFSQSLRHECAGSNCHVGLINPGMVRTDFFETLEFEPGANEDNALLSSDVADAVLQLIESPDHAVIEEINVNPLKRVVNKKGKS